MQNQSFSQYFVAAVPALFAQGQDPTKLAVGQIGIFNGANNDSVTTPAFPTVKEIYLGYRLPNQAFGEMANTVNGPYYSKPIKASKVTGWRATRGYHSQTESVTVGFDGVDVTKSLLGSKVNETKSLYILIDGSPITKVHSAQGMMLRYDIETGCQVCCPTDPNCDPCAAAVQKSIAEKAVELINADKQHMGYIRASVTKSCATSSVTYDTIAYTSYTLTVADSGDEFSLALVQAAYSSLEVERIDRNGLLSTYRVWNPTATGAPSAFSTGNIPYIANCAGTCPSGYKSATGNGYLAEIEDAGDATALTAAANLFNATNLSDSIIRISYIGGISKYFIVSEFPFVLADASAASEVQTLTANSATGGTFTLTFNDETTAGIAYNANAATIKAALETLVGVDLDDIVVGGGAANANPVTFTFSGTRFALQNVPVLVVDNTLLTGGAGGSISVTTASNFDTSTSTIKSVQSLGTSGTLCILETATTTAWVSSVTGKVYKQSRYITLGDTICGTDRLPELVAAYGALGTVTIDTNRACATKNKIVVLSNVIENDCDPEAILFPAVNAYDGNEWGPGTTVVYSGTDVDCVYGIRIDAAAVNQSTNECMYGSFTPDFDGIHIRVSEFDDDPNSKPAICTTTWPITKLQSYKAPSLLGSQIMKFEESTYMDVLRYHSDDAGVRAAEGFKFGSKPDLLYDMYTLEFDYTYPVGGFSTSYTDRYHFNVFFEVGKGKQFEQAMNAFVCSANPGLAPVNL